MRKTVWLIAAAIGVINAVVLVVFEFIGVDIPDWLWNDLLQTDAYRWRVLPVAILLGLALTLVIKLLRGQLVETEKPDLLAAMNNAPTTVPVITAGLAIGAMSLLAGGSIGPEAALMTASAGIGALFATRWKLLPSKQLLILASIGALLVAFVGSMVLALVPILLIVKQARAKQQSVQLKPVAIVLVACAVSFATLQAINSLTGESGGYGTAPAMPDFQPRDFAVAVLLGFVSGFLALCLTLLIKWVSGHASRLDGSKLPAHDWLVGLMFSAVLGGIYFFGGQTIQFSGSVGTGLLVSTALQYSALALVGLIVAKTVATAWSKGTFYVGGLVFPSIYVGVALGLLAGQLFSGLSGAGAMVGGISGMMTAAVGSPAIAAVFLISVLPLKLWPVGLCAIIGSFLFNKVSARFVGGN